MIAGLLKAFPVVFKTLAKLCGMPYILAQSAVPVCLAPNGTVATNGIVTLGTALPTTYSGGIWLRLPAGAVVGGLAGLYWAVMSSTTQGQVYTNFSDPATEFIPSIPSGALVAAVGSNAAYTQTTGADVTLANITIPAGALGLTGGFRTESWFVNNNSGGAKQMKVVLATSQLTNASRTTTTSQVHVLNIQNSGVANIQKSYQAAQGTSSGVYTVVNTAIATALTYVAQLAVATDFVVLEAQLVEVVPA